MANLEKVVSQNLAKNILSLRQKRGLSQSQLAELAGLPRSTLTYFESGDGNPSLQNLLKISAALQVRVEELLARPRPTTQLVRANEVSKMSRAGGLVQVFKLLPDPVPGMEFDRIEMKPGARFGGTPHTHNTKEYLLCVKGEVELAVHRDVFHLKAGDVLAFEGDQPHSYRNPGKADNLCISVVAFSS